MSEWWILILVTLHIDNNISTEIHDRYNYKPTCQIAAEGRQMLLTGKGVFNKTYVCINELKNDNS